MKDDYNQVSFRITGFGETLKYSTELTYTTASGVLVAARTNGDTALYNTNDIEAIFLSDKKETKVDLNKEEHN